MLALISFVILACDLGLSAAFSRQRTLTGLIAEALALTAYLATGAIIVGAASLIGSNPGWIVGGAMIFMTVILYVSSLNFLQVTGHCLDLAALRMVLVNARLGILHEASYGPLRAAFSVALMIVPTATLVWLLAEMTQAIEPGAQDLFLLAALAATCMMAFVGLAAKTSIATCRTGGPFSCLVADVLAARRFGALAATVPTGSAASSWHKRPVAQSPDLVILVIVDSFRTSLMGDNVVSARWMPQIFERSSDASIFHKHRCNAVMSEFSDISLLAGDLRWRSYFHGMPGPGPGNRTLHQWFREAEYTTAHLSAQDERWSKMHLWYETDVNPCLHAGGKRWPGEFASSASDARILGGAKLKDEVVLSAAHKLLDRRSGPMFLTINLQSTHVPFFYPNSNDSPWPDLDPDTRIRFGGLDDAMIETAKMKYANALHHVDALLAELVDKISDELGSGDAVLWITGDTGQAFGEHGYSGHGAGLHDELLHTPLLVFGDRRFAGVTAEKTHHLQIYGSLSGYVGAVGGSMLPTDPGAARPIPLVCQTPMANELGLIDGDNKYILDCRTLGVSKFDLEHDPGEQKAICLEGPEADNARHAILTEMNRVITDASQIPPFVSPKPISPTTDATSSA